MGIYVLVHGAWHTGAELEPTAAPIRAAGHEVHTPTIAGNRPGDAKTVGLPEAIKSIVDYITQKNLKDVVLTGHSYGGMVITGVADQIPDRIRRLVYWNAFVPNNGECLNDMVPPPFVALFDQVAAQRGDNSVVLPFPVWREAFINDADAATAKKVYDILNPHPYKNLHRQDFAEDQSGGHADRQVLHQLHRGHRAAASLPVASAAFAEARPVSARAGSGKP
jgi:pimeloyl-ACP methyl ester carboxylesterase